MEKKSIKSYQDLIAWQKSVGLVKEIYSLTKKLPLDERFGLTSQINRSSISIPANIAEGCERESKGNYVNFLKISRGSLYELESHLYIAKELEFISTEDYNNISPAINEISKILAGLIKSINN